MLHFFLEMLSHVHFVWIDAVKMEKVNATEQLIISFISPSHFSSHDYQSSSPS